MSALYTAAFRCTGCGAALDVQLEFAGAIEGVLWGVCNVYPAKNGT